MGDVEEYLVVYGVEVVVFVVCVCGCSGIECKGGEDDLCG